MEIMGKEYGNRMKKAKAFTGNVFDDDVVKGDVKLCTKHEEIINNILQKELKKIEHLK